MTHRGVERTVRIVGEVGGEDTGVDARAAKGMWRVEQLGERRLRNGARRGHGGASERGGGGAEESYEER